MGKKNEGGKNPLIELVENFADELVRNGIQKKKPKKETKSHSRRME